MATFGKGNWTLNLMFTSDLSSLMCSRLSDVYVNKVLITLILWNEVTECSKKTSTLYTLRLFIERCYLQIHCIEMEENCISPEWEGMNIASELCYAQPVLSLNGALYQPAISIKWVCLMWVYVHLCTWECVCVLLNMLMCFFLLVLESVNTFMYLACVKMMHSVQKSPTANC